VDEHAGEVALPHVRRRHHDAELLDRVCGDDLAAGPAARNAARAAEVEALALVCAVDGEGVVAVVRAGRAGRAARRVDHLRCELHEVHEGTAERREAAQQRIRDDAARALARGAEVPGARDADRQRLELDRLDRELRVDPRGGREANVDVVPTELLKTETRDGDRVRAADLESLDEVETVAACDGRGGVAGRAVHHSDLRACYRLALRVRYRSGDRAGGNALRADSRRARAEQHTAEQRRQSSPVADPHRRWSPTIFRGGEPATLRLWRGYTSMAAPADRPKRECRLVRVGAAKLPAAGERCQDS